MHQRRSVHDVAAEVFADRLQPETNAEHGPLRFERPVDHVHRLTGLRAGRPGPGPMQIASYVATAALSRARIVVAHDVTSAPSEPKRCERLYVNES